MSNDLTKVTQEYNEELKNTSRVWLRIRLIAGMEMMAQELGNGRKVITQDWAESIGSPQIPLMYSPSPYPVSPSPSSPEIPETTSILPVTRRRSGNWNLDTTSAFPTLFLPEEKVFFYSNIAEMKQAMSEERFDKIILNTNNIVCIEKVMVRRSYAQSIIYPDVAAGNRFVVPPVELEPLSIVEPETIPALTNPENELFFKVEAKGGCSPYRYFMTGHPSDLYITEDGYVRGYIENDQWPVTGYREFSIVILVEDSSVPKQTTGIELRYRLYPSA